MDKKLFLSIIFVFLIVPSASASILWYDNGLRSPNGSVPINGKIVEDYGWQVRTDTGSRPIYTNAENKDGSLVINVDMSGATGEEMGNFNASLNLANSCVAFDHKLGDTTEGASEVSGIAFSDTAVGTTWIYTHFYALSIDQYASASGFWYIGSATTTGGVKSTLATDTNWNHFIFCSNATGQALYKDTMTNLVANKSGTIGNDNRDSIMMSQYQVDSDNYYDNIYYCDAWEDCTPAATAPSITATNLYDSTAINSFTMTITNGTFTFTNSTTDGSMFFGSASGVNNITVSSEENGGYLNRTYINHNVANSLSSYLYQGIYNFNASRIISNTKITSFNSTMGTKSNVSNTNGNATFYLNAGSYELSAISAGYVNSHKTFSIGNKEIKQGTIPFGTGYVLINASSAISNTKIDGFSIDIRNNNLSFQENKTTASGKMNFSIVPENYTISITNAANHLNNITNITFTSIFNNMTFHLWKYNSLYISIFKEGTSSHIVETITGDFDSDTSVFSETTANGTIYKESVTPENYKLSLSATDYTERNYYFTMLEDSNAILSCYLLNSSSSIQKTFTIEDSTTGRALDNVLVSVSKKSGLNYVTIMQSYTDISGKVVFDMAETDEYRFTLVKSEYTTRIFDLTPSENAYTIEITPTASIDFSNIYSTVDYSISPSSNYQNPSMINFSLITASINGAIINNFGMYTYYNETLYSSNISGSFAGGTSQVNLNLSTFSGILNFTYWIDIDGYSIWNFTRVYSFLNLSEYNTSIKFWSDEIKLKLPNTPYRVILIVIFTILIIATFSSMGIRDKKLNIVGALSLAIFFPLGWISILEPVGAVTGLVIFMLMLSYFIGGLQEDG